jgi:hypothetical protein
VPSTPFEVRCPCGHATAGQRQPRHQVVRCPACQRSLFVLPASPLPVPRNASWSSARRGLGQALADGSPRQAPPSGRWLFWRWPLVAAGLTLVVVVLGLAALIHFTGRDPAATHSTHAGTDPQDLLRDADAALERGHLQIAADRYIQAAALLGRPQGGASLQEVRRVRRLAAQAKLVDELLPESLADVVHHAGIDGDRWPEKFADRYRGLGVIFDAEVRRDVLPDRSKQYRINYHVEVDGQRVQVELRDLEVLALLELEKPTRLLFGARLASVAREAGGGWVVRFQPDSGVLLTDERIVRASCPPPFDEDVERLLKRQAEWAEELP